MELVQQYINIHKCSIFNDFKLRISNKHQGRFVTDEKSISFEYETLEISKNNTPVYSIGSEYPVMIPLDMNPIILISIDLLIDPNELENISVGASCSLKWKEFSAKGYFYQIDYLESPFSTSEIRVRVLFKTNQVVLI